MGIKNKRKVNKLIFAIQTDDIFYINVSIEDKITLTFRGFGAAPVFSIKI